MVQTLGKGMLHTPAISLSLPAAPSPTLQPPLLWVAQVLGKKPVCGGEPMVWG